MTAFATPTESGMVAAVNQRELPMNAARRTALSKLQDALRAKSAELEAFLSTFAEEVAGIKEEVEALKDEEEEYKDAMHENLQGGERYQIAEEAISALEAAFFSIEEKLGELENVTDDDFFSEAFDNIEEAKGQ